MGFRGTLGRSLPSRHSGAALRGAVYFGGGALWGSPLPTRCSSSPCASSICPERSAQPQPPSELHAVPRSSGKPRRYVSHTREPKSRRKRSASPAHWGGGGCVTRDPQILQPPEIPPPPPPVLTVRCQAVGAAQEVQGGRGVEVGAGPQRPTWEGGTPKNIKAPNVKQAPLPNSDP